MEKWLGEFAYRIYQEVWTFLTAGLMALAIALATVSYQAIKVSLKNPVDPLRYE